MGYELIWIGCQNRLGGRSVKVEDSSADKIKKESDATAAGGAAPTGANTNLISLFNAGYYMDSGLQRTSKKRPLEPLKHEQLRNTKSTMVSPLY